MRLHLLCLVFLALGLSLGSARAQGRARPAASADSAALRALEDRWGRCMVAQNAPCLDSILASDWVTRWADGSYQTKAQYLAGVAAHKDSYDESTSDSIVVRLFGSAAVVTGIATERATFAGRDGSGRYAWLDLFVKRNGRWWAVQSQSTRIP